MRGDDVTGVPSEPPPPPPGEPAAAPAGLVRRLLRRGLVRAALLTYAFSALTLVANLVTGVVTARALGPDGRGITVALATVAQLGGFLFALGMAQSLSYFIARRPADGPALLTTWALFLLPLSALAIVLCQLLLPTIFAADGDRAIELGRWFLFLIVLVIALELNYGLLLGIHDYAVYNALRFAQPALAAVGMVVFWRLDELTVEAALIIPNVTTTLVLAVGLGRAVRRLGVGRPDLRLGFRTLWFGVRGQGVTVAANVNARLDLVMLPAFIASTGVGLYSVAANVSLIVYALANTFAGLVLPAAARDPERAALKVVGSLWAALAVAGALALVLGLFARPLLETVYDSRYGDADESLRLLLPGAVLFAGSSILAAGVYAAGAPFTATVAQLAGVVVTVVGLLVFLDTGGITAAAIVSSASYATVFVATLLAYRHVTGLAWAALLPTPARLRALVR